MKTFFGVLFTTMVPMSMDTLYTSRGNKKKATDNMGRACVCIFNFNSNYNLWRTTLFTLSYERDTLTTLNVTLTTNNKPEHCIAVVSICPC